MTEIADVRDLLVGFEEQNRIVLELRASLVWKDQGPDVLIFAACHRSQEAIGDQPPLASVNVRCSAMNLRTWNAALTHVLYALDFQLALNEMRSEEPKSV
jgi:hypothetical protein